METAAKLLAESNPGATIFARGSSAGYVVLAVLPQRLHFRVKSELNTEYVVSILRDAAAKGLIASDDFSALVDLTDFSGVIDWDEIKKISDIMPKGNSRNKNAYIAPSEYQAMVAKITAVLFPQTDCAAFANEHDARAWLGWD